MLVDAGTRVHEGRGWDDLVENEMVAPSPPPPIPLAIPLTLLGPGGGGTFCPPCHVFAYTGANTRTRAMKKLDFSPL